MMKNTFLETPYFALLIVVFFIIPVLILIINKIVFPFLSKREEIQRLKQTEKSLAVCSYAREDKGYAGVLKKNFKSAGIKLVIDEDDLLVGQKWQAVIDEYIERSGSFVYCVSTNAKKSANVKRELEFALNLSKEKVQFIKPYRWDKRVTIPEEIADINIEDIEIKVKKNKDGTETYYQVHSFTLKSARAMKSSTIVGLLFLIFIIPTLAFWGIREVQKVLFAEDINYEELFEKVPALKVKEIEPVPESSETPNPTSVLNAKSALPKLTNPNPISDLAPIIDYFGVVLDEDGKTTNDFDPNKSYESESEFRLVWRVKNAKSVKITPHIIDISPNDGEIGIGIVPKGTMTYNLEAEGFNGQTTTKKVTVNIEKGGGVVVTLRLPEKSTNVSSTPTQTPTPTKTETLPTPTPTPYTDLLADTKPSATKIIFEAMPLSELEVIENQMSNLNPPPYGKLCYEVSNVWWAKISPQIGEIPRIYSKRCKNINQLILGKKNIFTVEVNGWEIDPKASFGRKNKLFRKKAFFDLSGPKPNLGFSYTINKNEMCFTPKYVRYLIIKIFEPQNSSSFKPNKIIVKVNPTNNQEVCVTEKKETRFDITYVGSNGSSDTF